MKNLLLFLSFSCLIACNKSNSNTSAQPEGNEFGSGGYGIYSSAGLLLFEFALLDQNIDDTQFSDEKLYEGKELDGISWETLVRDTLKQPERSSKDYIHIFLNQLVMLEQESLKRNPDSPFASAFLNEFQKRSWDFSDEIPKANDIWAPQWTTSDFRFKVSKVVPIANRDRKQIRLGPEFRKLSFESHKAATLYHELYGSLIDEKLREDNEDLTKKQKRFISAWTRTYVIQSFKKEPILVGIEDLFRI